MQLLWTRMLDAPGSVVSASAVGADGVLWVAGSIVGPTLVALEDGTSVATSEGQNAFLARLSPDGHLTSFEVVDQPSPGGREDEAVRIAVDGVGSTFVLTRRAEVEPETGSLRGVTSAFTRTTLAGEKTTSTFQNALLLPVDMVASDNGSLFALFHAEATHTVVLGSDVLPPPGTLVVARLDSAGAVTWARRLGSETTQATALALGSSGTIFIASSERDADASSLMSIIKVSASGDVLKKALFVSDRGVKPTYIATFGLDQVMVAGCAGGDVVEQAEASWLADDESSRRGFVMRLSADLERDWCRQLDGEGPSSVTALAVELDGTLHAAGHFAGGLSLGEETWTTAAVDAFVVHMSADGTVAAGLLLQGQMGSTLSVPHAIRSASDGWLVAGETSVLDPDGAHEKGFWSWIAS